MVVEHCPVSVAAEFLDWEGSDIVESLLGRPLSFNGVPLYLRRAISNSWQLKFKPYFHDPLF
jgi:hypothetical protein